MSSTRKDFLVEDGKMTRQDFRVSEIFVCEMTF